MRFLFRILASTSSDVIPFNADNKAHEVEFPDWLAILN